MPHPRGCLRGAGRNLLVGQRAERVPDDDRCEQLRTQRRPLQVGFVQEGIGHDDGSRDAAPLELDRVVQTARRARASIADRGDYRVVLRCDPVQQVSSRGAREARLRIVLHAGEGQVGL